VVTSLRLDSIFNPETVAVIGASSNPHKFGYRTIESLKDGNYDGRIYPINPNVEEILGLHCYTSVRKLPEVPDLAAILVPASQVIDTVRDCTKAGIKGVAIISSGFAEVGERGKLLQTELKRIASDSGIKVIGPNCEGFVNVNASLTLSFSSMFREIKSGPISIVSQSGAYCGIVAHRISKSGLGLAKIVSSGNEADLAAIDYFSYLADDPETEVIVAYLEEIRKPTAFKERIAEIAKKKPVIIQKAGRTDVGKKAAVSHTGALAGSDKVVSALFRQTGVLRVKHIGELIDSALSLASQPLMRGNRIAVLSGAGGLAVETAELCAESGFSLPPLNDSTQGKLSQLLPYFAVSSNPVDMTGAIISDPGAVGRALELVLEDPNIDAILLVLTIAQSAEFAQTIHETMQCYEKPVLVCWTAGLEITPEPIGYLMQKGVPLFDSPDRLKTAITALSSYSQYLLGPSFVLHKE
jgi:acetate---CoA ligase (ADP-forming)